MCSLDTLVFTFMLPLIHYVHSDIVVPQMSSALFVNVQHSK